MLALSKVRGWENPALSAPSFCLLLLTLSCPSTLCGFLSLGSCPFFCSSAIETSDEREEECAGSYSSIIQAMGAGSPSEIFGGIWGSLRPSSSHPSASHSPSCPSPVQGCEFSLNTQVVTGMEQPACPHSQAMVISPRVVQIPLSLPSLLFSPISKLLLVLGGAHASLGMREWFLSRAGPNAVWVFCIAFKANPKSEEQVK